MNIPDKKLVDERVLDFNEWRKAIEKEDRLEGCKGVFRTYSTMMELYCIYRDFQLSQESIEARRFWYNRSA